MKTFRHNQKSYEIDEHDFLVDYHTWDNNFAEGMANRTNITQGLTREHWDVINAIRKSFNENGRCPLVYETCRSSGLLLSELKRLFPTGYLRGACKLAGVTYREGYLGQAYLPITADDLNLISVKKKYRVDVRGFLDDPEEWDEFFAAYRAYDMKIPGGKLSERHWEVIRYLRDSHKKNGTVPTVYDVCETLGMELDELERLFPDGYHRGAVKVAGLRVR